MVAKAHVFKDKKDVLSFIDTNKNIRYVNLLFPDILGDLRGLSIPTEEFPSALDEGKGFDGSSIEGMVRIFESDLVAKPDPRTFRVWPWQYSKDGQDGYGVGMAFCDILNPDGSPNSGDTRAVLKSTVELAKKAGFDVFHTGPELEYFYFPLENGIPVPRASDKGGYFSMGGDDPNARLRLETQRELESIGIKTNYDHHEAAPGQHEIDLEHCDALEMADRVMLHRFMVKETARRHGLYATFMPKPLNGENGSGMHVHQSLVTRKGDKDINMFFSNDNKSSVAAHLSQTAEYYIAGLLKHVDEITAVLNQWVNSYKRLVPGFEAPVYHSVGTRNRSALIRIPEYQPGKEAATRIELRSADPACNPYLTFALMLRAGLEGIKQKYQLPKDITIDTNMYEMSEEESKRRGIGTLPANLETALGLTKKSNLVKDTLGQHIFDNFIANKEKEVEEYRLNVPRKFDNRVSRYEIRHLLPRL